MESHATLPADVSVIIPCYKQADYLQNSIASALSQEGATVEVIVVDDGSPDDTAAVAARFGDRVALVQQANAGVAAARNAGLQRASGEFVHFLDADDFLLPGMLNQLLHELRTHRADVACCGWETVTPAGTVLEQFEPSPFEPDPFHALLPKNLYPPVCYVFRRAVVNGVGGFDPARHLSGHADWDLLLRVASAGARFTTVQQVLVAYRTHAESMSMNFGGMYDSGLGVLKKAQRSHPSCPNCGARWIEAHRLYQDVYAENILRAAATRRPWNINRKAWKHLLLTMLSNPSFAVRTARQFILLCASRAKRIISGKPKSTH